MKHFPFIRPHLHYWAGHAYIFFTVQKKKKEGAYNVREFRYTLSVIVEPQWPGFTYITQSVYQDIYMNDLLYMTKLLLKGVGISNGRHAIRHSNKMETHNETPFPPSGRRPYYPLWENNTLDVLDDTTWIGI